GFTSGKLAAPGVPTTCACPIGSTVRSTIRSPGFPNLVAYTTPPTGLNLATATPPAVGSLSERVSSGDRCAMPYRPTSASPTASTGTAEAAPPPIPRRVAYRNWLPLAFSLTRKDGPSVCSGLTRGNLADVVVPVTHTLRSASTAIPVGESSEVEPENR